MEEFKINSTISMNKQNFHFQEWPPLEIVSIIFKYFWIDFFSLRKDSEMIFYPIDIFLFYSAI